MRLEFLPDFKIGSLSWEYPEFRDFYDLGQNEKSHPEVISKLNNQGSTRIEIWLVPGTQRYQRSKILLELDTQGYPSFLIFSVPGTQRYPTSEVSSAPGT